MEELFEIAYQNSQMHRLTILNLFDMEGLVDEPEIVSQLVTYLQ